MTKHKALPGGIHAILRRWPLVIIPALLAVGGSLWSASHQTPTYTATAKLVVIPLAQWDETFIGTSLVRDAGDAKRTAATLAALLDSRRAATVAADYLGANWTPEAVHAAIRVRVAEDTNVITVVAQSADRDRATKVAEGFANATLADRWQTISRELDTRIVAFEAITNTEPIPGDAAARLHTLKLVRAGGFDPTLRIDSTTPAVRDERLSVWASVGLAAAGGLFVGLLAAVGVARLRRSRDPTPPAKRTDAPQLIPAYSPNGDA
jgi:capsular polysaccharide biosynthesis protein